MEIVSITPRRTPLKPMVVQFKWNNGNIGYIEIDNGNIQFVRPVKEVYWHFVPSGYKPTVAILNAVVKMVLTYSKEYLDNSIAELRKAYTKAAEKSKALREDPDYYLMIKPLSEKMRNIYSQAQDLKTSYKDIELLEKKFRGENNEKVC